MEIPLKTKEKVPLASNGMEICQDPSRRHSGEASVCHHLSVCLQNFD